MLDKLIAAFCYPLGTALCLGAAGLLLLRRGRTRGCALLVGAALAWLVLWSLPPMADAIRASLETRYPELALDDVAPHDAIVVLGGVMRASYVDRPWPDLGGGADRVWHAARLYHAGKAPRIVVAGGPAPSGGALTAEGEAMRQLLVDFGVPEAAISLELESRNTRENAQNVAPLLAELGARRVLLVTSALHMPRSVATFRGVGIEVTPAPTDFEVVGDLGGSWVKRWLPNAEALHESTQAIHEYVGWLAYWLRGWTA